MKINRRMNMQYDDASVSIQLVYEWGKKIQNGVSSVRDCSLLAEAHWIVTPELIATVERITQENRRLAVSDIA